MNSHIHSAKRSDAMAAFLKHHVRVATHGVKQHHYFMRR